MSPPTPAVSIVIPTFNRERYLGEAIRSALAQDWPRLEVLVLDNASTDGTPGVVRAFAGDPRLRSIRNDRNLGMVGNWRRGVYECATGDWFLLLSDDDYLTDPGYVGKAMALAASDPEVVLVYANGELLVEDTQERKALRLPFQGVVDGRRVFLSRGRVAPQDFTLCNVLFRRPLAMQVQAFQNPSNLACDSELFLQLCLHGKVAACPDSVSVYRMHTANLIGGFQRDFDTLLFSSDAFLVPYRAALARGGFAPGELEAWRRHTVTRHLRWMLRAVRAQHRRRYGEAVRWCEQRYGDLFWSSLPPAKRLEVRLRARWAGPGPGSESGAPA
jgi:glycosyltransferase involved in cell wall biosynthesis